MVRHWLGLTAGLLALIGAGCGECGSCGSGQSTSASAEETISCCSENDGACEGAECCPLQAEAVAGKNCCADNTRAKILSASAVDRAAADEPALALAPEVAAEVTQEAKNVELKVGDPAPAFEAPADEGKTWKSSDHVGKKVVVVYFYPADFTGGCTRQACAFRDDFQKLADKGVEVVGVSGDSAKTHALFKKQHKLNFALLADEEGAVAKKFGVPLKPGGEVKAKVDAQDYVLKRGVTALRWTFVIGKDGKIAYKNTKVNAAEDPKDVLKVVEGLGK